MLTDLLPTNATTWEEAMAEILDTVSSVSGGIASIRGTKIVSPPPSFLPFLVYEYGLEELKPYVTALYALIEQGIDWQRVRGTHTAVAMGLGFVGYTAAVEEALSRRRFWNSFQLRFPTLPPADLPDLFNVAGVAQLSVPKRSVLRRGVYRYDVGPLETDTTRLDSSLLDAESGVPLWEGGPIWSFGRAVEFDITMSEADGVAVGNWIEPTVEGSLSWDQMTFPWTEANFPWSADAATARKQLMASWFKGRPVYFRFSGADGVIGYRLGRSAHQVAVNSAGLISLGATKYAPSELGIRAYVAAMTGFGDGAGRTATSVSLVYNATRAPGVKPGQQWLQAGDLIGGQAIATQTVNIPLRPTVREEVKFILRF